MFISLFNNIFLFATAQKSNEAENVLKNVAQELSKGINTEFTISVVADKKSIEETFSGTLLIKGDKFMLDSPGMKIWYNGELQWAYNTDDDEVTITEVSPQEENSFNIMSIINNTKKYSIKDKGSESLLGKKYQKIELQTKNDEKDIVFKKVTFLIGKNNLPHSLAIETRKDENLVLIFNKISPNFNIDDSVFVFPVNEYKNVFINDLR